MIIAHRPETIAGAQRVVQLVNANGQGAVVEEVLRAVAPVGASVSAGQPSNAAPAVGSEFTIA